MIRNPWTIAFACAWSSVACAQSPDRAPATSAVRVTDLSRGVRASLPADAVASRADSLVRAGRAWRATLLLAPSLRTPASASPPVRLVGARAAAAWNGWTEVERVLRDAPWLDSELEGEGRELIARAALERGLPAVDDARRALSAARSDAQRSVRLVLLARALDRANVRDSAAEAYSGAAARLPVAADWLRLRAAGVTGDSARRAALMSEVTTPPARARIPWTDAQARERAGDFPGAARLYRSVGAEPAALRVDALAARDDASRAALVERIVTYLARSPQPADARLALDVLETQRAVLSRAQELVVARAAANAGVAARAIAGFQRALAASPLAPSDQLAYASALARLNRAAEAIELYEQVVSGDAALAPLAAYQRARLLLQSGNGAGARTALRAVATRYPEAQAASAPALLLLADLQVDDGDLAGASRSLAELARRYPDAEQAPLARLRGALLAFGANADRAAAAFDSLSARYPDDEEAPAARYWAARALDRAGRRAEASSRWSALASSAPLSYYGMSSARRLGKGAWSAPAGPDTAAHVAAVDTIAARVRALQLLGMDVEARFELDALAERGERATGETAAIAEALIALGQPARGLRLATRVIERGGAISRALLRSAYPVLHADALVESAQATRLDPSLVAGLIRQESTWNPEAVSPAGARGLMQIMPAVGAAIAAGRGYPVWNPVLLFEPEVSLQLGTLHLASTLRDAESPARALAAYNAGASRVSRWSRRPGASDPELFTEWIPYVETRDYVRVVQRNAVVYEGLYSF